MTILTTPSTRSSSAPPSTPTASALPAELAANADLRQAKAPARPPRPRGWRMAPADDLDARRAENRGRLWLVLSYVLCPCHLPVTLTLVGMAFGGSAIGTFLTTNSWRTGAILGLLYTLALWRGFSHLRRARAAAGGRRPDCSAGECRI